MLRKLLMATLVAQAFAGLVHARDVDMTSPYDPKVQDLTLRGEPPMLGIHWSREFSGNLQASRTSKPLMTNHGGKVMTTAIMQNIFWGASWANSTFVGDKITGLEAWYTGFSLSNYAHTTDEYSGSNGKVGPGTTYAGHIVDTTTASGGNRTSTILAEVCKRISPDPSGNGYYSVYSDVKRGNANYCAYHSEGTCGGVPVQFAFFWNLDGDSGCDPQDTSGQHSQGLAALANVSGHELSEARTDPSLGTWYDSSGSENGDKCAWTFGAPLVAFTNNISWKIQGEWSNAAYTAGTGYPNASGQKGCLSGK
ncbi:hypothetical protein SAMN04515620_12374 [Collimonas sp. OK607]|uniref:hypothetical protein n=1 Tax=Collimonas sp. OK607 TaxID=1798194 RepID=UPI0008EFE4FD|nr:hypothetical protein [Collimonas sp. OK607]SFB18299.1 hypothetical protein SAMN04515620_12374 [Collimonas sp. OK607]